ncbi:hypothetical protein DPEC_G00174110 [Dallia pectoralis]|uniref:Uncharacterized protein n=1 Tax=Dallia pectoralis TaxID=75939 RepID=A0ACC2GDZ6_DALPE|nr:hypothetical protein DPEC_G00174110 [Dallia pectoralis]
MVRKTPRQFETSTGNFIELHGMHIPGKKRILNVPEHSTVKTSCLCTVPRLHTEATPFTYTFAIYDAGPASRVVRCGAADFNGAESQPALGTRPFCERATTPKQTHAGRGHFQCDAGPM